MVPVLSVEDIRERAAHNGVPVAVQMALMRRSRFKVFRIYPQPVENPIEKAKRQAWKAFEEGFRRGAAAIHGEMTLRDVLREVSEETGFSEHDLCGPWRNMKLAKARHYLYWRCRRDTTASMPQIGRYLGGKDHTTILHGIRAHEARMAAKAGEGE